MKDEEMADKLAEDYVMREDTITENDRVPFDNGYGFQTVDFEKEVKKGYKDGFLAGLNAGRPQWHDLRKDPNDLPKECKNVLCFVWQGEGYYCVGHIIKGGDNSARWWASNKSEQLNVIAWCEIPQFKE